MQQYYLRRDNGNVVYDANGKVLKGENYKAPDLNQLI